MNHSTIAETAFADVEPDAASDPESTRSCSLRKFPYPYEAALAICSDIDQTRTTEEFLEIQEFLNTHNSTRMGPGVGLEIGNSFFFYNENSEFSYFDHDQAAQQVIVQMIKAGYIDCLHSYGDVRSRDDILRAVESLDRLGCRLDVWVNHSGSLSNLCPKFEHLIGECRGDDPDSDVYHADVTCGLGIRFIWAGAMTRIVGQSPANPTGNLLSVLDSDYPLRSARNALKEVYKMSLGWARDDRYVLHQRNELMRPIHLQDGRPVYEFMRFCSHPIRNSKGATSQGLSYVISQRILDHLKKAQGSMIVYAHLGKNDGCRNVIAERTQKALRSLAAEYRAGTIYVTTTSKLLNYHRVHDSLRWFERRIGDHLEIHVPRLDDPITGPQVPTAGRLQGITFYVPQADRARVFVGDAEVLGLRRNARDATGLESVTIPQTSLSYPL